MTVFRSRLRADAAAAYGPLAERMESLARAMPGFVSFKTFEADDGERVSVVVFADRESHEAWRDHPEHRSAQAQGRASLYEEYDIQVCRLVDERRFRAGG